MVEVAHLCGKNDLWKGQHVALGVCSLVEEKGTVDVSWRSLGPLLTVVGLHPHPHLHTAAQENTL